jgi:lycopene cyclase domain-containing protein
MYEYVLLMIIFAITPSLILLYLFRDKINIKILAITLFTLFILGIIWDFISVKLGIWNFTEDKIIGILFGMPIEEYLFMIFVPLLVITVYTAIETILKRNE